MDTQIWINRGAPNCPGEVRQQYVKETADGVVGPWHRITCTQCNLDWYNRTS